MIKNIIISFIIGIGKIIPGVSGSMLAISFGVYNKIIESILNPIKNIKFILSFIPGFTLALSFGSIIITKLFELNYHYTILFFVGLISGIIPKSLSRIKKYSLKELLFFTIVTIITVLIPSNINRVVYYKINIPEIFMLGLIEAFTTIIPGISGTAILLTIGRYDIVMSFFKNIFNISMIKSTLAFGIPYIIGIVLGIYITSKLINKLINKNESIFFTLISSLSISSLIMILKKFLSTSGSYNLFIGCIIMSVGLTISAKFDK